MHLAILAVGGWLMAAVFASSGWRLTPKRRALMAAAMLLIAIVTILVVLEWITTLLPEPQLGLDRDRPVMVLCFPARAATAPPVQDLLEAAKSVSLLGEG